LIKQNIKTFYDIRQQVIWGNKYIKLKGKCLVYKHLIDSNTVYINDLLPDDGSLCELIILTLINIAKNWIIESLKLKKVIPKTWLRLLTTESSILTKVKTSLRNGLIIVLEKLSNKKMRDIFIQTQFQKPYIHNVWIKKIKNNVNWENMYYFLNCSLVDNRIKQYRYKLLHRIIAINKLRISNADNIFEQVV